ncbi:hypothetical protein I3760_09G163900 [Carya illinoinensis]|nr:hypothetical protein I3760_09G163900 [Carya illinoinensis]
MTSAGDTSSEATTEDPGIKLFGRKIQLPECSIPARTAVMESCCDTTKVEVHNSYADNLWKAQKPSASGDKNEEPHTPLPVETPVDHMPKELQLESNTAEEDKVFKKPDKLLQCPRCNSFDTKFCYFNNYNIKQPRHFCKNCQRYWTAGGTMRNVPVGAGRRKNMHLASQHRQIMVSYKGVATMRSEALDQMGNGTFLKFGPEAPLSESIKTFPHLRKQKLCVEMGSGNVGENKERPSCRLSMTASSNQGNQLTENIVQMERVGSCDHVTMHSLDCYPVPQWGFPWTAGLRNAASVATEEHASECITIPNGGDPNSVQCYPTPRLAVPGFHPPSIPLQFLPASYWGCTPVWPAGAGSLSMTGSSVGPSPSPPSISCYPSSGTGKHSRDVKIMSEERSDTCIMVPKT